MTIRDMITKYLNIHRDYVEVNEVIEDLKKVYRKTFTHVVVDNEELGHIIFEGNDFECREYVKEHIEENNNLIIKSIKE